MKASTKYYIDFIYDKDAQGLTTYFQLVRTKDDAILYANEEINNIFLHCWKVGIANNEVTVL